MAQADTKSRANPSKDMSVNFSASYVFQLFINGIVNGSGYAMLAVGFGLILHVTGRFHIAYAAIYATTAFIAAQVGASWHFDFVGSMVAGVLAGVIIAVGLEAIVYAPLAKRAGSSKLFIVFIAALGLNIAGQSILGLIWPNAISMTNIHLTEARIGSAYTTNLAVSSTIVAWVVLLAVWVIIRWTKLGRMIRAVRVNPELSTDIGVDPRRIFLVVFAIATAIGGINVVFIAAMAAPASNLGQTTILYAVTAAFVAGPSASVLTIAAIGLLIGLIESLSGIFVTQGWQSVVVFSILLIYVIVRAGTTVNWSAVLRRKVATPQSASSQLGAES